MTGAGVPALDSHFVAFEMDCGSCGGTGRVWLACTHCDGTCGGSFQPGWGMCGCAFLTTNPRPGRLSLRQAIAQAFGHDLVMIEKAVHGGW